MSGWTKRVRRRAFCRGAAALLPVTLALAAVPVAEAAPAVPGARRSTPALLDEAVARGDLDRSTADEHLVEVFVGRGRSDKVPAAWAPTTARRRTRPGSSCAGSPSGSGPGTAAAASR